MKIARDRRGTRPAVSHSFPRQTAAMRAAVMTALVVALALLPVQAFAQLAVVSHAPTLNAVAATSTAVSVTFDRALNTASVDDDSFRVFGHWSGAARGTFSFSNGDKTVTLTPDEPLSGGETVFVNLSHDLTAADATTLRSAGYAFQFRAAVPVSAGIAGKARIGIKGKGLLLDLPNVGTFDEALDVQLHNTTGTICWGATFTPPFLDQDSTSLKALSDAP